MSFSGTYEGTLRYGKEYPEYHDDAELTFQMIIDEVENSFYGIATDTGGVGTSPDEAKVVGIINENIIVFEKAYKRQHYSDKEGNTIFNDEQEGFPISYEGKFNAETGFYEGTWKYNVVRRFLFFFRRPIEWGSGTFQLKRVED